MVDFSQTAKTDKKGLYSFSRLYSGKVNTIGVSKEGFKGPRVDATGRDNTARQVTIDGDTRIDLELVRR